jgi:hypothetical protein
MEESRPLEGYWSSPCELENLFSPLIVALVGESVGKSLGGVQLCLFLVAKHEGGFRYSWKEC